MVSRYLWNQASKFTRKFLAVTIIFDIQIIFRSLVIFFLIAPCFAQYYVWTPMTKNYFTHIFLLISMIYHYFSNSKNCYVPNLHYVIFIIIVVLYPISALAPYIETKIHLSITSTNDVEKQPSMYALIYAYCHILLQFIQRLLVRRSHPFFSSIEKSWIVLICIASTVIHYTFISMSHEKYRTLHLYENCMNLRSKKFTFRFYSSS